jgi:hypothetical protein
VVAQQWALSCSITIDRAAYILQMSGGYGGCHPWTDPLRLVQQWCSTVPAAGAAAAFAKWLMQCCLQEFLEVHHLRIT